MGFFAFCAQYPFSYSAFALMPPQFMGRMNKPDVDYIKGITPAIAIEQKVISSNSCSTEETPGQV